MLASNKILDLRTYFGNVTPPTATVEDISRNKGSFAPTALTYTKLPSGLRVPTFNGTTTVIPTSNNNSVKGRAQISLSVWFNTAVLNAAEHTIYNELTAGVVTRFVVEIYSDNRLRLRGRSTDTDGITDFVTSSKSLAINSWYHLLAIFDSVSDNHYLYLNAAPETANVAATSFTNVNSSQLPRVGSFGAGGLYFWSGMLSHLKLYTVALSATQVWKIFNAERHLFGV